MSTRSQTDDIIDPNSDVLTSLGEKINDRFNGTICSTRYTYHCVGESSIEKPIVFRMCNMVLQMGTLFHKLCRVIVRDYLIDSRESLIAKTYWPVHRFQAIVILSDVINRALFAVV